MNVWVVLAILAAMVVAANVWVWRDRGDGPPYVRCDGVDWDGGTAHICTTMVGTRTGHPVAEVEEFTAGGISGGTAMLATYCAHHCPGGCANPRCRQTASSSL